MYHVELRQFPHNHSRFNLTEPELRALTLPWAREQVVEVGERKWSPQQAKLTILEGPQIPVEQLSMGRGWRTAQRDGEDVTERLLDEARRVVAAEAHAGGAAGPSGLADPLALGVQLASLLGDDPARLLAAWRDAVAARPELSPSESLALAEREILHPGNHG
ncbi:MAG: hypothetical protein JWM29_1309 [Solirubrobacterales bacterium]|nr:hypothetical protein [Solirubrobacterales bacterium]